MTGLRQGLFQMPFPSYLRIDALSNSGLKTFERSPAHFLAEQENPKEQTPAQLKGEVFHCALLESEKLDERYIAIPEGIDRRTKDGKAEWAEFLTASAGKTPVKKELLNTVQAMRDSIFENPRHREARELLSNPDGGFNEISAIWENTFAGERVWCKGRPDRLTDKYCVDLKTTVDASKNGFRRAIEKYRYHWQVAWYLSGLYLITGNTYEFRFIAVEPEYPYAVGVYRLDPPDIDAARQQIRPIAERYAHCRKTGEYPGYSEQCETITLSKSASWVEYEN